MSYWCRGPAMAAICGKMKNSLQKASADSRRGELVVEVVFNRHSVSHPIKLFTCIMRTIQGNTTNNSNGGSEEKETISTSPISPKFEYFDFPNELNHINSIMNSNNNNNKPPPQAQPATAAANSIHWDVEEGTSICNCIYILYVTSYAHFFLMLFLHTKPC